MTVDVTRPNTRLLPGLAPLLALICLGGCGASYVGPREFEQQLQREHAVDAQWYHPAHFAACTAAAGPNRGPGVCDNRLVSEVPEDFLRLADCNICRLRILTARGPRVLSQEEVDSHTERGLAMRREDIGKKHASKLHAALKAAKRAHQLAALLFVLKQQPERAVETYRLMPGVTPEMAVLRAASVASLARLHAIAADLYAKQGQGELATAERCLASDSLAPLVEEPALIKDGKIANQRVSLLVRRWCGFAAKRANSYVRDCDDALVRHQLRDGVAFAPDWLRAADFCTTHGNDLFKWQQPPPGSIESGAIYATDLDEPSPLLFDRRNAEPYDRHWEAKFSAALVRNREIEVRPNEKAEVAQASGKPFDLLLIEGDISVDAQRGRSDRTASAQASAKVKRLPSGWAGQLWLKDWTSAGSQTWTMGIWIPPRATPGTSTIEGTVTVKGQRETTGTIRAEVTVEAGDPAEVADVYWSWAQATMAKQDWQAAAQKVDGTVKFAQKMVADGAFQFAGDILTNPEAQRRREALAQARARFLGYREMVASLSASRDPKIASVAKARKADLDSTPVE